MVRFAEALAMCCSALGCPQRIKQFDNQPEAVRLQYYSECVLAGRRIRGPGGQYSIKQVSDDTTLAELLGTVDLPGTSPFKSKVKRLRQLALVGQVSLLGTLDMP